MKETGELLKNRRLEKKYSLEEISSQTKIQLSILKSLEEGRIENLKNKTYTKGFLRQYARALQLNPEDVIAMFEQESSSDMAVPTTPVNKLQAAAPIQDKTNVLWFRAPAKVITIAGVLLIGSLATAIYFFSMKMASYSQETFKDPSANEESQDPSIVDKSEELPADAAASTPTPSNTAAVPAPAKAAPVKEKAEETTAKPKAEAAIPAKAKVEEAVPAKEKVAQTEAVKPPPAEKLNKEISVVASEAISIEASWVGGQKETVKLKANGRQTFYYPKKITLVLSNGSAATVTANGEKVNIPGEAGKPATLTFE
jgi:cytoskeletal protein RodZ